MTRLGKRVVTGLVISSACSLTYLTLGLYHLFQIAEQDKLIFILLVGFTVEVIFWIGYLGQMCCRFSPAGKWHLDRITYPLWDLVFVLVLTILGLQLQQSSGYVWWDFSEQPLTSQITTVAVLSVMPLKLFSNGLLSQGHRHFVRASIFASMAYDSGESIPLVVQPTAPGDDEQCY